MKRREFVTKTATAAGSITLLPRTLTGGAGFLSANDRINLGFVGVGKQTIGFFRQETCNVPGQISDMLVRWFPID